MRFTEFRTLLEYDRSKTVAALGNGILKAAGPAIKQYDAHWKQYQDAIK